MGGLETLLKPQFFSFRLFLLSTNNYLQTEIGYEYDNNAISPPSTTTWSRLRQAILPSPLRRKAATFITNTRNDDGLIILNALRIGNRF